MEKKLWYAVDRDGWGAVFTEKPIRDDYGQWIPSVNVWAHELISPEEKDGYPNLTWEDEPVEIDYSDKSE